MHANPLASGVAALRRVLYLEHPQTAFDLPRDRPAFWFCRLRSRDLHGRPIPIPRMAILPGERSKAATKAPGHEDTAVEQEG